MRKNYPRNPKSFGRNYGQFDRYEGEKHTEWSRYVMKRRSRGRVHYESEYSDDEEDYEYTLSTCNSCGHKEFVDDLDVCNVC